MDTTIPTLAGGYDARGNMKGPTWLIFPGPGAIPLAKALEQLHQDDWKCEIKPSVNLIFLDATWKYAREMDKANLQHEQYPKGMLRVEIGPTDMESFVPRRFGIRKPPSEHHLSTAEASK
jgi:DTW domain-containing protein YfiP